MIALEYPLYLCYHNDLNFIIVPGYERTKDFEKETCNFQGGKQIDKLNASPDNTIYDCAILCNNNVKCKYFFFNENRYCAIYSECKTTKPTGSIGSTFHWLTQGRHEWWSYRYHAGKF